MRAIVRDVLSFLSHMGSNEGLTVRVSVTCCAGAAYLSQTLIGVFTGVVTKEQDTNAADTARVYSIQVSVYPKARKIRNMYTRSTPIAWTCLQTCDRQDA